MAEGCLETCGHEEAAETVQQCCSDQTPQWQSERHQQSGGKRRSLQTQEVNPATELKTNRNKVSEPEWAAVGTAWISQPRSPTMPYLAHFYFSDKNLLEWGGKADSSELCKY